MNISATSRPNSTKFYLKHHLGGGLIALGFGPGRIGTLVFMATDSSHRVIMEKTLWPLLRPHFDRNFFILSDNNDNHKIWTEFEFGADRTKGCGVSALSESKNSHRLIMEEM